MKRGRYNRPFLHVSAIGVLVIGAIVAPVVADTYPVFSTQTDTLATIATPSNKQSITVDDDVFKTDISQKPRDTIVIYTVEKGDTLSSVAKKFGISTDTIKWENGLKNDSIVIGDALRILPVTGMAHKVVKGDTIYSIAKKYDASSQAIVDFPFNEFANPETFSLVEGQILIVPDGVKPEEKPTTIRRQLYIPSGPISVSDSGFTWPVRGYISQFAAWYHMALDIVSPFGTPVVAGQTGRVVKASAGLWEGGYGTHIIIENDNGYSSLYAHMSGLNVGTGDYVVAGQTTIGWVGLTGRTTGAHLHFEIRRNGALVNPISYLQ